MKRQGKGAPVVGVALAVILAGLFGAIAVAQGSVGYSNPKHEALASDPPGVSSEPIATPVTAPPAYKQVF